MKTANTLFHGVLLIAGLLLSLPGAHAEKNVEPSAELSEAEQILAAEPEAIGPDGELGAMFSIEGDSAKQYTKTQKTEKKAEVTGKIVKWTLEVYKVKKDGDAYRIQNNSGPGVLSTFVYITPHSDEEKRKIKSLKMGDVFTVKGRIDGFSLGSVFVLKPAFLVEKAVDETEQILTVEPEAIGPDGELGAMFSIEGDSAEQYTKTQKTEKKAEVIGKIVEWTLEVYKVKKDGDAYRIQNNSAPGVLSTFVYITPHSDEEKRKIKSLKMGDVFTVKARIDGFSLGRVFVLKPAFLVEKTAEAEAPREQSE